LSEQFGITYLDYNLVNPVPIPISPTEIELKFRIKFKYLLINKKLWAIRTNLDKELMAIVF